ncbi:MAG: paraquat-inducible protein A [Bacterioplanes sp.]|nr:paraquat-inducible protein A [Bacterioplanes sp.]
MKRMVTLWQAASWPQRVGLLLSLVSYGLLYPGVTEPIMTVNANLSVLGMKIQLLNETRSIWQTVLFLQEQGYRWIGWMILTFSVIFPAIKAVMIVWLWLSPSAFRSTLTMVLSKWSMADVFVVALLIAFFSAQATNNVTAQLEDGFYWFTAFCVLSIAAAQCLTWPTHHAQRVQAD